MRARFLLILCLTGNVFAQTPPDVDCTVVHLKYVECLWNSTDVNYTFYSKFYHQSFRECDTYIIKDGLNVGCKQYEDDLKNKRFNDFETRLKRGELNRSQLHKLKNKVKLYPPTNLTVQFRSDSGLWYEWRQIFRGCVESEVRYRVNNNNWVVSGVSTGRETYFINLPSNSFRYELQVRSRVSNGCGQSEEWSDWSQPVLWGTHNITDVDCRVIHLKYVECLWNSTDVNYTFYSKFYHQSFRECDTYIIKDGLNVGCKQHEDDLKDKRFNDFETRLKRGELNRSQLHKLKTKVKLYPPTNVTVQFRSDSGLWYEWRQIFRGCVESEVRYRVNNNNWVVSGVSTGRQTYLINLPSNSSRYELQVRSRVSNGCGQSEEWSDWSQPVVWGTHNITDPDRPPLHDSVNVWSVVMYCVGGAILLLLVVMLLHHERIRIILIPIVPKPSLVPHDLQEWLDSSKGLKEAFKTNYLERTCSVREYCPVPPSDSESSDSSNISVSTDQTNCSGPVPNPDPNDPTSCSSTEFVPTEEHHISV